MRRDIWLVSLLLLGGCASMDSLGLGDGADTTSRSAAAPAITTKSCEGRSKSQCTFINSPVKLSSRAIHLPGSAFPFYRTREELDFIDATRGQWIAPAGTLTDGASIPPMFVPLIGNPRSKEFMNAATVHDAYCAESNKNGPYYHTAKWQKVHRMFYDGLRASGTPAIKAMIMYSAVYLGGPRWSKVRKPAKRRKAALEPAASGALKTGEADGLTITAAAGPGGLRGLQSDTPLTQLYSRAKLISAFKQAKAYIQAGHPSIDMVETYLTQREQDMSGGAPARPNPPGRNFRAGEYQADPGGDGNDGGDAGGQHQGRGHSGGTTEGNSLSDGSPGGSSGGNTSRP